MPILTDKDREEMAKRKEMRRKRQVRKRTKASTEAKRKIAKKMTQYEKEERTRRRSEAHRKERDVPINPATQELANRELAKRHLLPYVKMFNPDYQAGWVHKDICNRLERFFSLIKKKQSPRVMLMVPPRHGKSTLSSKEFPSWALGKDPNIEFILSSYALPLASGFSREVRDRIQYDPQYHLLFPETKIAPDSRGVEEWRLQRPNKGRFQAAGVGGPITGKGADCFPAGTRISTPFGGKNIEEMRTGDLVYSYDFKKEEPFAAEVEATNKKYAEEFVEIETVAGRKIRTTPDHRVYVLTIGWVEAWELCPGYVVTLFEGLDSISKICRYKKQDEPVYDIQVARGHCFFAEEILVHNCFIIDDPVKNREEADSLLVQQSTWNWYTSTAYTRLSPGGGMCVILCMTGDTPVSMADGTYKMLEDIRPGDMVWAWKDGELVTRKVLNWAPQGEDDVYEIKTGNSTVRANGKHPFLVRSAKGRYKWVKTEDLDKLGVSNCLVQVGKTPIEERKPFVDEDEAWLLGYMFGDGWLTRRDTTTYDKKRDKYYPRRGWVTCCALSDKEEENRYVAGLFESLFGLDLKNTGFGYIRTEKQEIGKWFAEHGLIGKAKTKRLPSWLYSEPLDIRLMFLEGFIAADGSINGRDRVSITLCNKELIRDIRHLARLCGYKPSNIASHHGVGQPPNSPKPINYSSYNVQWQLERSEDPVYFRKFRVKKAGKALVYDLQVEDAECFVADGLVSHNTRWHEQDLGGRVIDNARKTGEEWDIIRYSALAEDVEYYDTRKKSIHIGPLPEDLPRQRREEFSKLRDEGDALHPDRYDTKALNRIKETAGPRDWSALYQQRPVAEEGDFIKKQWLRFHTPLSYDGMKHFQAWDLALGLKDHNNYSCGITGALDWDGQIHVRDVVRGRWPTSEIAENILRKHRDYDSVMVGIEQGQTFLAIQEDLRKLEKKYNLHPSYDDSLKPIHDKAVRGRPMQGQIQLGNVIFPEDAMQRWPWLFEELLKFPALGRDDGFDALAWLVRMSTNISRPRRGPSSAKQKSWKDELYKYKSGARSGNHLLA